MLVQRRKTPNKMIFLWLAIAVVVLIAGFIVYQNFVVQTPGSQTGSTNTTSQLPVPQDFGQDIFTDPRFGSLTNGGVPKIGYSDQLSLTTKSLTDIASPSRVAIFNPATGGKLVVSWSPSEDSVTGYDIYRSESLSGGYEKIAAVGPDVTNYADTRLLNGTTYYYRIKAVRYTELDRAVVAADAPAGTVKAQQISSGGMLLDWDNPTNSTIQAISIIRRGSDDVETQLQTSLNEENSGSGLFQSHATFEDPNGSPTDSYILVWYSSFADSTFSETQNGKPTDTTPPDAPLDVEVINIGTGTSIMLRWTNPLDSDFDFVKIRRSTNQGDLGDPIKTARTLYEQDGEACQCSRVLKEGESCTVESLTSEKANPEGNCYIDQGQIRKNTTYYYTVTSVDIQGNESSTRIIGPYGNAQPFATSTTP